MSAEVIRSELLKDTTSVSALDVYNLNPGIWNNPSDVPRYLYTCLLDLASGTANSLDKLIVADYGTNITQASLGIIIQPTETIESVYDSEFISADSQGAEKTRIDILVKLVKTSTDFYLNRDIGLRIRYILDLNLRALPNNQFMLINSPYALDPSVIADNSIDPGSYYKMSWEYSAIPAVSEQKHRFICSYIRCFY